MSFPVPVGFRFYPKDYELINYYLYNRVNGVESVSPAQQLNIPVVDTYSEEPWEIWERYERQCEESLYFFAILKTVSAKGKRIDRRTTSRLGRWYEGEKCRPVDDEDGNQIGKMRKFRYESEHASHNAAWNLTEYSSSFSLDLVICNLRKNKISKRGNKRKDDLPRLESTSPEVEDIMPESKRLREAVDDQIVDNTWTNMPSVNEEDSPQSLTNTNGQKFGMPSRINTCYTNQDQQPVNGGNLHYAADLSIAEDGFKTGYSYTNEDRQVGNGENLQYGADLSNANVCSNYFEGGFGTGSNNTTYENQQLDNGGNLDYASGLDNANEWSNYVEDGFKTGSSNTTYEDQRHGNDENLHYAAGLTNFNDRSNYFEDGLKTAFGEDFHYAADLGSSMSFSDVNDCNNYCCKKELQESSIYQGSYFTSKSNLVGDNDYGSHS